MASITIRNLDDDLKRRLRVRAAKNGRSMEAEAREILRVALDPPGAPRNLGQSIHDRFAALGGVDTLPVQRKPRRAAGGNEQPVCFERFDSRSGLCISALLNNRGC